MILGHRADKTVIGGTKKYSGIAIGMFSKYMSVFIKNMTNPA
jgi:hypothetical protein